jgi:hypothetical protein
LAHHDFILAEKPVQQTLFIWAFSDAVRWSKSVVMTHISFAHKIGR